MTKITTINDLRQWVRDRVDADVSDGDVKAIVSTLLRMGHPNYGADWTTFLAALPENLCEVAGDDTLVCDRRIQVDRSGVGHAWTAIDADDIPANIREEIEGEIIEGDKDSGSIVASNGLHYRW